MLKTDATRREAVDPATRERPLLEARDLRVWFPRSRGFLRGQDWIRAVDGISLTVAGLGRDRFDVQIVPYTLEHTNLSGLRVRDQVNLECDMVGKYVVRAAQLAGLTPGGAVLGELPDP